MLNPIQSIAYRLLHSSLASGNDGENTRIRFSRRAFLALTAGGLSSCATSKPQTPTTATTAAVKQFGPFKDPKQSVPVTKGPIPHNPNMNLSSDFNLLNQQVTYTSALISGQFVAMTFDDGPHPQNTPRLLQILRERNIKATFYVIGNNVQAYPQVLRQTIDDGHEIGNHTQNHRLLSKLGDDGLNFELQSCRNAVLQAAGYEMKTMRPPYGGLQQRQRQIVHSEFGYPTILWSVDPLDWKRPGPSVVASRIIDHTRSGSIVLAHDLHAPTVDAMPRTLDELLYRGYKFVTVSQLLAMQSEYATANPPAPPLNS